VKIAVQEARPPAVRHCFLEQAIRCIAGSVQGRPTELFVNLDEVVRLSEWENRLSKKSLPFDDEQGTATFLSNIHRMFKQTMIKASESRFCRSE
jgi:hypothetical protein